MRFTHFVALGGLAVALACGGSATGTDGNNNNPPPPVPGTHDVTVKDYSFSPQTITIKVGETVRWTNQGPSVHHVISDQAGVFDAGDMLAPGTTTDPYGNPTSTGGSTFSHTFTQAGTFTYHCMNHPPAGYKGFTGTIIVQP